MEDDMMSIAEANKAIEPYLTNSKLTEEKDAPIPLELKVAITVLQSALYESADVLALCAEFLKGRTDFDGVTPEECRVTAELLVNRIRAQAPRCWFCEHTNKEPTP